jgi:hypothetical protein
MEFFPKFLKMIIKFSLKIIFKTFDKMAWKIEMWFRKGIVHIKNIKTTFFCGMFNAFMQIKFYMKMQVKQMKHTWLPLCSRVSMLLQNFGPWIKLQTTFQDLMCMINLNFEPP